MLTSLLVAAFTCPISATCPPGAIPAAQEAAPKVVSCEPPHLAVDVDAATTKTLVVTFDRAMQTSGFSVCGGGEKFPKMKSRPRFDSPTKLVLEVELEPDHDYAMSLNCPSAQNFVSKDGVRLAPYPWSFTTAPAKLPDQRQQRQENRAALAKLRELLASRYSYYDRKVKSWPKLFAAHEKAIVEAKTTRGFASAAAAMLAATEDIHLHLRLGERTFAAGRRSVDSLYRGHLPAKYFDVGPAGDNGLAGCNGDGIGYLMIAGWTSAEDIAAIEAALAKLRDCKAMVVDVRPNSGGDERLAQRVAAWFVTGTKVYAKNRYRERAGGDGFGRVLERTVTGNAEPEQRLSMPIAVLTSRYVMSSNESFVMMLRQADDCTVVGQPTYGSSGNPKPHELPNGVTVFLPSWKDLRLDGSCFEGEGLAPDVEVAVDPAVLADRDPILERALEELQQKLTPKAGK